MSRQEQIRQHRQQQLLNQQKSNNVPMDTRFSSIENKQLIWKTLLNAGQFNDVHEQHKPDIMRQIDNVILQVHNQYGSKLQLIELNKRAVFEISQYITKLKNLDKPEVYKSDKLEVLNKNLQQKQNERTEIDNNKLHNEINFEEPKEEKINLNEELKRIEEERKNFTSSTSTLPKGWMTEQPNIDNHSSIPNINIDELQKMVTENNKILKENNKKNIELNNKLDKILTLLQVLIKK